MLRRSHPIAHRARKVEKFVSDAGNVGTGTAAGNGQMVVCRP